MKRAGFLLALFTGLFSAAGADSLFEQYPYVVLPKMQSMKIDGNISEDEEKSTIGMTGLCRHGSSQKMMLLAPVDVKFNIGTDGRALYLSAVCEVGPRGILERARAGRAGERAFLDDCFEFVFVPDPREKMPSIYHIIINNKGGYMTSARKGSSNIAWNPNFSSKGRIADGKWIFEAAFPVTEFGLNELKPGQEFGVRFCRNWKQTTREFGGQWGIQSSWSQDKCAFFSTDALPIVVYEPGAPVIRFLSVTAKGKPDMKLSVQNPDQKDLTLQLAYEHKPSESQSMSLRDTLTLKPGEKRILTLPTAQVTEKESVSTGVALSSADGRKVYYRRAFRWSPARPQFFLPAEGEQSKIALKYAFYPEKNNLYIQMDFSALRNAKVKALKGTVTGKDGNLVAEAELPAPEKEMVEYLWQLPDMREYTREKNPSGEYQLKVTVSGTTESVITRKFERKLFEWEGNTLGKSERLLPRFTPIRISGNQVSVVLRSYTMNKFGLFDQIKADGDVLLDEGGIRFEAVVNGRSVTPVGKSLKFTGKTDTRASAAAEWSAGGLEAAAACSWDYDGVMKYALTLKPFAGRLDSLKMIIPLLPRNAYLFHACTDGLRFNYGGAVPEGQGQVWNSTKASRRDLQTDYVNYIWLGTEGRGLAVFGENDKGWVLNPRVPAQELIREKDKLYLVCHFVSRPVEIKTPRTLEIAFQATPVKPMAENWRRSAIWSTPEYALPYLDYYMVFLGSCKPYAGETASNDIAPRDNDISVWKLYGEIRRKKAFPETYTDRDGRIHKFSSRNFPKEFLDYWCRGYVDKSSLKSYRAEMNFGLYSMRNAPPGLVTFYTNARGMRTDIPEARTFCDDWFREEFQGARDRIPERPSSLSYSLTPVESFRDYAMFWYQQMITTGACDNLYWDDVFLASNMDHSGRSPAYRLENGSLQPSVGLWDMRELIRRAAVLQLELGRQPNNMVHMTNTAISPICAFAQQNLDWEEHLGTNPFQQRYTKEYIRALSIGRQFGNLPGVLGLVVREGNQKAIEWCLRTGAGVSLTHEVLWTKGGAARVYWKHRVEMLKFGYGKENVRVWNYWNRNYPVRISGDTSSILLSKPAEQEAVLLVCDYGNGGDFTANLDLAAIGLNGDLAASDWESGRPLKMEDGRLSFTLKKYDFIHIRIKKK